MDKLVLFNNSNLKNILNKRTGESKFGEHVVLLSHVSNIYEQLQNLDVDYVIFGIPEDIGVFANYGKRGAYSAWNTTLKTLLNIQSNVFTKAKKVVILGHLDFTEELLHLDKLNQSKKKDIKVARTMVAKVDTYVTQLVHDIIKTNKKPIIIGGGHNNAYGNIKGSSLALKTPINVINFDAHSDLRDEEGRHSGNGFRYAINEGLLNKYAIFGLHENYTSTSILDFMHKHSSKINYTTFETIAVRKEISFTKAMQGSLDFIKNKPFGIEIDCDAIENVLSSAMTPSGFSTNKTRAFVSFFSKQKQATYLHICEAAPKLGNNKKAKLTGKLISYLITDFILNS